MKLLPLENNYDSFLSDESYLRGKAEFIVFPSTREELAESIKTSKSRELRATIQGSRTGIVGGAVPQKGLIISLRDLSGISDLYENNGRRFMRVRAGTTLDQIDKLAASVSCFFPPNPTEVTATIGGMYSSGSAGPSSLLYGRSSDFIESVTWITASGEIWEIERGKFIFGDTGCTMPGGSQFQISDPPFAIPLASCVPRKGLDLIDFLSGNEGKLGVAYEFTLALSPLPSDIWGVFFFFDNNKASMAFAETLSELRSKRSNFKPLCAEYYDSSSLKLLKTEKAQNSSNKEIPSLPADMSSAIYLELSGDNEQELELVLSELLDTFSEAGGKENDTWATHGLDNMRGFRALRHALPEASGRLYASANSTVRRLETDFTGPQDKFAEYISMYREGIDHLGIDGIIYGHILKNSLHCSLFCNSEENYDAASIMIRSWALKTIADGGFIVSENGIGRLKSELVEELLPHESKKARDDIRNFFDADRLFG